MRGKTQPQIARELFRERLAKGKFTAHPAADKYPMFDDAAAARLAADIAERGLQQKILIDPKGRIVDGRNRVTALITLGKTGITHLPDQRIDLIVDGNDPDGTDPKSMISRTVESLNLHRRHLTPEFIAAKIAGLVWNGEIAEKGRPVVNGSDGPISSKPQTQPQIAAKFGVSVKTIKRKTAEAKAIAAEHPELVQAVKVGTITPAEAIEQANAIKQAEAVGPKATATPPVSPAPASAPTTPPQAASTPTPAPSPAAMPPSAQETPIDRVHTSAIEMPELDEHDEAENAPQVETSTEPAPLAAPAPLPDPAQVAAESMLKIIDGSPAKVAEIFSVLLKLRPVIANVLPQKLAANSERPEQAAA